jgi:hypothetical protein
MKLISDADPLLGDITYQMIGSDTVICLDIDMNVIYICAHLKDYKPLEDENGAFTKQFNAIQNIINHNTDKCIILMMDANTQIQINHETNHETNHSLINVFSKNGEKDRKTFIFDKKINISACISEFPTSNKMRGVHTAQLNKSLVPFSATIDHILIFNAHKLNNYHIGSKRSRSTFQLTHVQILKIKTIPYVMRTDTYVVNEFQVLNRINSVNTLTTSPQSIPDHAFVISTLSNNMAFGTLNIKGGIVSTNHGADFEFIPQSYYDFFINPLVKSHINNLLLQTFKDYMVDEILDKDFISSPRCKIFDSMLPNDLVPLISINNDQLIIKSNVFTFIVSKDSSDNYIKPMISSDQPILSDQLILSEWFDIIIKDLNTPDNNYQIRTFLLNKGYLLLNYWHMIQTDQTILVDGKSLHMIYSEIYIKSNKLSIGQMIKEAKILHPNLHVISLQEMPFDPKDCLHIIENIKQNLLNIGYEVTFIINDKPFGSTRGVIISFN